MNMEVVSTDEVVATKTQGDRLKEARDEVGMNQTQLAELVGAAQATISKIERGVIKDSALLIRIARVLNRNPEYLESGRGPKERGSAPEIALGTSDYPTIQRVRMKVAAGVNGYTVEPIKEDTNPVVFSADWFRRHELDPAHLFAMTHAGAGMEPGLYDGDTIVVNTNDRSPADGEVYVINYEGEVTTRRLFRMGQTWTVATDHLDKRRHPDRPMHDGAFIIGHVVHKRSERI